MKAMEILAVKHIIPIAAGAGAVPLVGSSALASFALGALVAGVCFAALTTPWWRGGAMLVPVRSDRSRPFRAALPGRPGVTHPDLPADHPGGHLSGLRSRIDALLTGLLSDDEDDLAQAPEGSGHEFVAATTAVTEPRTVLPDDPDDPNGPDDPAASVAERQESGTDAAAEPESPAESVAAQEPAPEADLVPARAGAPEPDESFWGPMSAAEREDADGHHGRRRLAGPGREPRRSGGMRNAPRHAAPPARFSVRRALGARRQARPGEVSGVAGVQARAS